MKEKGKLFFKENIKRKRTWIIIIVVVFILGYLILKPSNNIANTITEVAKLSDLKETVLATGQVVSSTDLSLSFSTTGVVKSLKVKVGDKVKEGQVLATLEQGSEAAALTSAKGALAASLARRARIIEGASNEEIALSEITFEQTKLTQNTLLNNAYQNLLNSKLEAVPKDGTSDYVAPVISGTYNLNKEGNINITSYYSVGGVSFTATGITNGSGISNTIIAQPIGDSGLFITFPNNTNINVNDWVIEIPNKKASNYLSNLNAYNSAVSQAKSAIDQREAELALKKARARSSDIDLANADILSAQGQVQAAEARYNNTIITAPVGGTITRIDIKIGELASAQKQAIVLQDVSNIYLEANINEANITSLTIGMPVDITYDSFGGEKVFNGNITKIDPSSTLVSGVVNYKVTVTTEQIKDLRPGMTANMTIKVKEKSNIITVPTRSIITDDKIGKAIRLITNTRKKKWQIVPVTLGATGDGGVTEILSGLSVGDEFVILIKNK